MKNPTAGSIRAFIAIEISERSKKEISSIIAKLRSTRAHVKWTDPGLIHITLKFLGTIPEGRVDSISEKISYVSKKQDPFRIDLAGINVFPMWRMPKVIWLGINDPSGGLKRLARSVDNNMEKEGFLREKRAFSPHITLGRFKSLKKITALREMAQDMKAPSLSDNVDKIILFKSDLNRDGAVHTPVFSSKIHKSI